jgi:F-type H+-transporting ATPase subunit gamma
LPNLRDIRKRIQSVKGTQKLTRAMKLVAAAKLRRAQDNLIRLRPYARKIIETASLVAARLDEEDHPLLSRREGGRVLFFVLTSDKGLCGGFNANVLRHVESSIAALGPDADPRVAVAGKKGLSYFRARKRALAREMPDFYDRMTFEKASQIASWLVEQYTSSSVDRICIVYNEFKTAVAQRIAVEDVLPFPRAALEGTWKDVDILFEPDKQTLLEKLLTMAVANEIYRAILESIASEHGARMTAMENATSNADDMIRNLTLAYNKARQAAITKELMEIVGGSEAQRSAG